jgi:hypothetical protein
MNGANQKKWEVAAGVVYVALFLYVCVLRPAPEQRLSNAVAVEANPAAVAALLKNEASRPLTSCSVSAMPLQIMRWAAGESVSVASLLTACEQVDFSVESGKDGNVLLRGEMRWQVRGGLLGSMLDNVLARTARRELLSDCLGRLRSRAELTTRTQNRPQAADCRLQAGGSPTSGL